MIKGRCRVRRLGITPTQVGSGDKGNSVKSSEKSLCNEVPRNESSGPTIFDPKGEGHVRINRILNTFVEDSSINFTFSHDGSGPSEVYS